MSSACFKYPNDIILSKALSDTAKIVAAVLYKNRSRSGIYQKDICGIAAESGLSKPTVSKGLGLLEREGFIKRKKKYQFSKSLGRVVYAQTLYLLSVDFEHGFTMIPNKLLRCGLKGAQFTAALFIYSQMGNKNRAFPKINAISKAIHVCRATVCRALSAIRRLGVFHVLHCIKKNGAFTSNSYYRLTHISAPACEAPRDPVPGPRKHTGIAEVLAHSFLPRIHTLLNGMNTQTVLPIRYKLRSALGRPRPIQTTPPPHKANAPCSHGFLKLLRRFLLFSCIGVSFFYH